MQQWYAHVFIKINIMPPWRWHKCQLSLQFCCTQYVIEECYSGRKLNVLNMHTLSNLFFFQVYKTNKGNRRIEFCFMSIDLKCNSYWQIWWYDICIRRPIDIWIQPILNIGGIAFIINWGFTFSTMPRCFIQILLFLYLLFIAVVTLRKEIIA